MASYNYPEWFSDKQKDTFDKIREVAASIDVDELLVDNWNQDTTVLIRLKKDHVDYSDWDAMNTLTPYTSCLFAEFCLADDDADGFKSYVI